MHDEMDEIKNPVEARELALDVVEGAIRGSYKVFFCEMCNTSMPCDCSDELDDCDVATMAKYDAYNKTIDDVLVLIGRQRP